MNYFWPKKYCCEKFIVYQILPELLRKWYSRTHVIPPKIRENVVDNQNTCTCWNQNIVSDSTCSDKSCVIKTYHLSCNGLEVQPKGRWFCPYCTGKKKLERRNEKKHFEFLFLFFYVTVTEIRLSVISLLLWKTLQMNQRFKAFKVSVIKVLEKYLWRNPVFWKLQALSDVTLPKMNYEFLSQILLTTL